MTMTFLATVLLGLTVGLAERCRPTELKPLGDHVWAVEAAGHTFVDLRATTNRAEIAAMVSRLDVLMLSGGEDVNPKLYGQASTRSEKPNDMRDAWEVALIREAVRQGKGIVGICRGSQMINVALGGTLCQHVPDTYGDAVHDDGRKLTTHAIRLAAGSRLAQILGTNAVVNSWHHQSVERLAPGLRAVAWAPDGVVEAIEHETLPIAACQFHPEIMLAGEDKSIPAFQMFVQLDRWLGIRPEGKRKGDDR